MEQQLWFVPAWAGETGDSPEPAPGQVFFFSATDLDTGEEFVPVFDEYTICMEYIESLSVENQPDLNLAVVQFGAIPSIDLIIQAQFGRRIPLRVNLISKTIEAQLEEEYDGTQSDSSSDG